MRVLIQVSFAYGYFVNCTSVQFSRSESYAMTSAIEFAFPQLDGEQMRDRNWADSLKVSPNLTKVQVSPITARVYLTCRSKPKSS